MSGSTATGALLKFLLTFLAGGVGGYFLHGEIDPEVEESPKSVEKTTAVVDTTAEIEASSGPEIDDSLAWAIPARTVPESSADSIGPALSHPEPPVVPVLGVKPSELYDSFGDSRSGGRMHRALDIIAPEGTPVIASVRGEILRYFWSDRGGETIYQRGEDGLIYYYAHLQRYEPGIEEGEVVEPGRIIGYVGNTGNAGPDNYHLHFGIWKPTSEESYWDGEAINPYTVLTRGNMTGEEANRN